MTDTMDSVLADAEEVFGFVSAERPQERAHAYLERRCVRRECGDTALLCVARDLIARTRVLSAASGRDLLAAMGRALTEAAEAAGRDGTE